VGAPFSVTPYSHQKLKDLFAKNTEALSAIVASKQHTDYFKSYFNHLSAQTIIVENDYIDHDFLEDYAGYYVRCFNYYRSRCTRLHFFDRSFTKKQFLYTLIGKGRILTSSKLQDSYLGFIVLKPLPKTFVGRTCLRTYEPDGGRRCYPILREYPVSLFGLNLKVRWTLAFQEQDSVVAACATSALWTTLHGTGKKFQHVIPSPVEITRMATSIPEERMPGTLPNRGLSGRQEAHVIRQIGLEPRVFDAYNPENLKGAVYSYLRAGIPLLLRQTMFDVSPKPRPNLPAGHAVAVTGFRLGGALVPEGKDRFLLRASRIDELYVHDDGVGPFARMVFDGIAVPLKQGKQIDNLYSLHTSWKGGDLKTGSVRAVPRFLLIPLYPKIRILFHFIRGVVRVFDHSIIRKYIQKLKLPLPSNLEWDIYLSTIDELKKEYSDPRIHKRLPNRTRNGVLMHPMPKYIWRAIARANDRIYLELLFDATDIEQGQFIVRGIEHNPLLFALVRFLSISLVSKPFHQLMPYWPILKWFATKA